MGGHVEPNMSYEETAVKECKEETGMNINSKKLFFLAKMRKKSFDKVTGLINNTIRAQYAYLYDGLVSDLKVEDDNGEGFEAWKISRLSHLSEIDKNRFISLILNKDMLNLFNKAKELLAK